LDSLPNTPTGAPSPRLRAARAALGRRPSSSTRRAYDRAVQLTTRVAGAGCVSAQTAPSRRSWSRGRRT